MRKIKLFMATSIDGLFEGPNNEIDWHNVDAEFNDFAASQMKETDLLLFGRKTYQLMESYWPTEMGKKDDPVIAKFMNDTPKIVLSNTLKNVSWKNTRLIKENVFQEIKKLKSQKGKDIMIFGSSDLCVSLLKEGLLDEIRILVNPIILGKGKKLFEGLDKRIRIKLVNSRTFKNQNVLLTYEIIN